MQDLVIRSDTPMSFADACLVRMDERQAALLLYYVD